MGCNSCGGSGAVSPSSSIGQAIQEAGAPPPPESLGDYTIIEYVGGKQGIMNMNAPSGQVYRFSALETERKKYVRREDAPHFLQFHDFREVIAAPVS